MRLGNLLSLAALAVVLLLVPAAARADDSGVPLDSPGVVAAIPAAPAGAPVVTATSAPNASPDAIVRAWTWLQLHWASIAFALGVWAFLASILNRVWPRPAAPRWKVLLHEILIDWPAMLPTVDMRGIFGLPVNVPFITLSKPAPAPAADGSESK